APFFVYVNWVLPYSSSYLSLYFSVRSRALALLVSALTQIAGTAVLGTFLDSEAPPARYARTSFVRGSHGARRRLLGLRHHRPGRVREAQAIPRLERAKLWPEVGVVAG
ncbi:hypothetical protein LZ30DRAFT_766241, partial [Colletotrichum cereale]